MAINILLLWRPHLVLRRYHWQWPKCVRANGSFCRVLGLLNSRETFLSKLEIWVQKQLGVGKSIHCGCVGIGMSHVPMSLLWAPQTLGLKIFYRAGPGPDQRSTFFFLKLSWRARSILWHVYLYFFTYVFSSNPKAFSKKCWLIPCYKQSIESKSLLLKFMKCPGK